MASHPASAGSSPWHWPNAPAGASPTARSTTSCCRGASRPPSTPRVPRTGSRGSSSSSATLPSGRPSPSSPGAPGARVAADTRRAGSPRPPGRSGPRRRGRNGNGAGHHRGLRRRRPRARGDASGLGLPRRPEPPVGGHRPRPRLGHDHAGHRLRPTSCGTCSTCRRPSVPWPWSHSDGRPGRSVPRDASPCQSASTATATGGRGDGTALCVRADQMPAHARPIP